MPRAIVQHQSRAREEADCYRRSLTVAAQTNLHNYARKFLGGQMTGDSSFGPKTPPGRTDKSTASATPSESSGKTEINRGSPIGRPDATLDKSTVSPIPADLNIPGYEILSEIGRGGMGVVYKARHLGLNRLVALKLILAGGHATADNQARFLSEAEAVATFSHPNIVQIHDIGRHDNRPYMAMEFIDGGTLADRLKDEPLPPMEAARLVEQLARAMNAAHQAGIVHRDLKPANVLLASRGEGVGSRDKKFFDSLIPNPYSLTPKISDFGLAKRVDAGAGLTQTGNIIGTPSYMAPEQASGEGKRVGPAADVYALGAILYECLTGRPPFQADIPVATVFQVINKEPAPPRQLRTKVPRDLDTICLKCLQKNPTKRYGSAGELADDLKRFGAGEPIRARPVGNVERTAKWIRRHPLVAGLLAAVLLVTLAGIGGITWALDNALEEKKRADEKAAEAEKHFQIAKLKEQEAKASEETAKKRLLQNEWLVYAAKLREAQLEWESNNAVTAIQRLHECRWDFRGWEHDYLWTLFRKNQCFLVRPVEGFTDVYSCKCLAFSPDGKFIAGGNAPSRSVKVWDASTGREVCVLRARDGPESVFVYDLDFSPDSKRLVCGSLTTFKGKTGVIRMWDVDTRKVMLTIPANTRTIAFSADGNRIVSGNKMVRVWDAASGKEILTMRGHTGPIHSVAVSPDGKHIVSGSEDETLKLWNAGTGKLLQTLSASGSVRSVAFSADGKRIISGGDKVVTVWDSATGRKLRSLRGHTDIISSIAVSPDGRWFVSGSKDKTIRVWDAATGQQVRSFLGHSGHGAGVELKVAFGPAGRRIASSSKDTSLRVWEATANFKERTLRANRMAAVSADGRRFACLSEDRKHVAVWNADTGHKLVTLREHDGSYARMIFSADGKSLIVGNADGKLGIWDVAAGHKLRSWRGHERVVRTLAMSANGKYIASGCGSQTLKLWNAATRKEMWAVQERSDVESIAFSPDGKHLVNSTSLHFFQVRNAATGKVVRTMRGHTSDVASLAYSADGKRIVSGSWDNTVKVWDAETGQELRTLRGHNGIVYSAAFSPNGKRIVSAGHDKCLKIWDAATGQELLTLRGHTGSVYRVSFGSDGKRIISAGSDKTVKVWDAGTSQDSRRLLGHHLPLANAGVSADGRFVIATERASGRKIAWDAITGRLLPEQNVDALTTLPVSPDGNYRAVVTRYGGKIIPINYEESEKNRSAASLQRMLPTAKWHDEQARQCEQAGQWFAAVFHLRRLLKMQPQHPSARVRLSKALLQLKKN